MGLRNSFLKFIYVSFDISLDKIDLKRPLSLFDKCLVDFKNFNRHTGSKTRVLWKKHFSQYFMKKWGEKMSE